MKKFQLCAEIYPFSRYYKRISIPYHKLTWKSRIYTLNLFKLSTHYIALSLQPANGSDILIQTRNGSRLPVSLGKLRVRMRVDSIEGEGEEEEIEAFCYVKFSMEGSPLTSTRLITGNQVPEWSLFFVQLKENSLTQLIPPFQQNHERQQDLRCRCID